MKRELTDVQAGFRKGRGTRDQIANIHWIIEKAREFQKNIYFCCIDYAKAFDCVDHNKLWKIQAMGLQTTLPASWEICMHVKKQQLEPDMEQQTGSKLVKEYKKAVYCHPAFSTSLQSTSWNSGLYEAQSGIKISERNNNNLKYANDTILMAESEEELRASWWQWKRKVKKLA